MLPELWFEAGSSGLDFAAAAILEALLVLMTMVALILDHRLRQSRQSAARTVRRPPTGDRGAPQPRRRPRRIVRQLLTESLVLALLGGALGHGLRLLGHPVHYLVDRRWPRQLHPPCQLDWPVLGFTLAFRCSPGMLFGVAPAFQATRVDLTPALKTGKAGGTRGPRRWTRVITAARALVTAQLALWLLLVMGAALFVRNLVNLQVHRPGLQSRETAGVHVEPARSRLQGSGSRSILCSKCIDRIRQVPGVRDVGLSSFPLVSRCEQRQRSPFPASPQPRKPKPISSTSIPIFCPPCRSRSSFGRSLEARDLAAPRVVGSEPDVRLDFLRRRKSTGPPVSISRTKPATSKSPAWPTMPTTIPSRRPAAGGGLHSIHAPHRFARRACSSTCALPETRCRWYRRSARSSTRPAPPVLIERRGYAVAPYRPDHWPAADLCGSGHLLRRAGAADRLRRALRSDGLRGDAAHR